MVRAVTCVVACDVCVACGVVQCGIANGSGSSPCFGGYFLDLALLSLN